jgi:hypothetical protein
MGVVLLQVVIVQTDFASRTLDNLVLDHIFNAHFAKNVTAFQGHGLKKQVVAVYTEVVLNFFN